MTTEKAEALSEVLDMIHDIAAKAASEEGIPSPVEHALDKIIALARYKSNVTNQRRAGAT